jgi:hypothetical protein
MRQFLIALFSGVMIATAADQLLFGGANTIVPAQIAGSNALNQFNYQLSLLLRKVP